MGEFDVMYRKPRIYLSRFDPPPPRLHVETVSKPLSDVSHY